MPTAIGTIISDGKPEPNGNSSGTEPVSSRSSEPQILHGFEVTEPDTERITGGNATGAGRRTRRGGIDRRTREGRALTRESATEEKESVHLSKLDLADVLLTVHLTLSEFTKVPELEIDKDEADTLSDATKELAKFYNVSFDPKKVAIFNFCLALGKVYVPRAIAVKNRMATQAKPKPVELPKPEKQRVNGAAHDVPLPSINPLDLLGGAAELEG